MLKLHIVAVALIVAAFLLSLACSPQAKHPNQLNAFDGATYDSLTVAHAALGSLRITVSTTYPQYKVAFNDAATAYQLAFEAYSTFRSLPAANQAQTASAIANLTVSIIQLESAFQADLHVEPAKSNAIRQHTLQLRAARPNLSISDILTELQIAASVASAVPAAQPYAALAQIVISATSSAINALTAVNGQPIDLSTLTPVAQIS